MSDEIPPKSSHKGMSKPTSKWSIQCWSFFEAIYCINLSTRVDRRESVQKIAEQYSIPINMFIVEKHPNGGVEGCFDSHLRIIKEAYDKGLQCVCIFEDDISVTNALTIEQLRRAIRFLRKNKHWDLFYLGTLHDIRKYSAKWLSNSVYQLKTCGTHAYCISRRMMETMLSKHSKFTGIAIDDVYKYGKYNTYGIYPCMFNQGSYTSDISNYDFYNRKEFHMFKQNYFRSVELYARYINIPLIQMKWIVFSLLVILLLWLLTRYSNNPKMIKIILIIFLPILAMLLLISFSPFLNSEKEASEE